MDSFSFPKPKKTPLFNKPTKVLLLCLKNPANYLLTQDYLFKIFSEYGTPNKVVYFLKFFYRNI